MAAKPTFNFLQITRKNGATIVEVPADEKMRHDLEGAARRDFQKGYRPLSGVQSEQPDRQHDPGSSCGLSSPRRELECHEVLVDEA
ncbi:MAG: hypothetical protein M5U12_22155 [Verrucomicrobia bacterium]|nr:hypothetical protein [Verrucomicrobiota bacterium]